MTDAVPSQVPESMPENETLNALISAGVKGNADVADVARELVNSTIYLGSMTGEIKDFGDVKPLFLQLGDNTCVVVCISTVSCEKFRDRTPFFIAMRAAEFILRMQPDLGLYVEGDRDAFILRPQDIARIKSILTGADGPSS